MGVRLLHTTNTSVSGPADEVLWFCAYTPLEVLDAAGLVPRRVLGDIEHLEEADAFLHPAFCPYVRACLAEGMRGEGGGMAVFVNSCDAMRRLYDAWRTRVGGRTWMLDMPRRSDALGERRLASSLLSLIKRLREETGREITPAGLREAAVRRGEVARHFTRLGEGLAGSARIHLAQQAQCLPPREFLSLERNGLAPGKGMPLLVTGNLLNLEGLVDVIEEYGGWLKAVDLCNGERPFSPDGELGGETEEELCLSLAQRYLARRHCARMLDARERDAHLLDLVRETGARGVLFCSLKFCDTYLYDFPRQTAFLEEAGIPSMRLESDYQDGNAGQLSTRIEAFIEMLGG